MYRRYGYSGGYNLNSLWAILGVNVAVYIMYFALWYSGQDIIGYLALERSLVWPRLWTLVTSMFMHGPIIHIALNMLILYMFGSHVITLVGQRKFLLVYFVGGLAGNLLFILISPAAVVGASGAIFALLALLAVMMPKLRIVIFPLFIPMPLWGAVLIGLIVPLLIPWLFGYSVIAWEAHLGGAIAGAVFGFFFRRDRPRTIFYQ